MASFSTSAATAPVRNAEASTDSELVAEVRRGDPRAFEELYGRYHRRIVAYVNGMVGDFARAEDLTQDVFLSALRRMRDTERPIAFKPWIYEIAKNACIDQFRRSRRAELVSYDAEEGLGAADYGRLVSKTASPDTALDRKQTMDDLLGAFDGLNRTHHQILVMRELEGLTYREIGDRLGMSRAAVESTLFRARRRLGEEYQELATGERCARVHELIANATVCAPGVRDRRRLSAHLSHCQPCRRHAAVAGLEVAAIAPRGARAKIAGLIPLPGFLWERWSGESRTPGAGGAPGVLAQVSSQVAPVLGSGGAGWGRAAAAAAALAAAAVAGEQVVAGHAGSGRQDARPAVRDAAVRPARSTTTSIISSTARTTTAATATAPAKHGSAHRAVTGSAPKPAGSSSAPARMGSVPSPARTTSTATGVSSPPSAPATGSVPTQTTVTTASAAASPPPARPATLATLVTPATPSATGSIETALAPLAPAVIGVVDPAVAALDQVPQTQGATPIKTLTDVAAAAAGAVNPGG